MTMPQRTMDGFGSDDMAIPEIKLIQNTGGSYAKDTLGADPGDFHNSLTDEIFAGDTGVNVIIVDIHKTRTFWGRDELRDEPPECSSLDANSMVSTDGVDCRTCEHRCDTPWAVSASERRSKCLTSYIILVMDPDTYMPALIRAGGISTKSIKELVTQLRLNSALNGEYHRALVTMMSDKKQTPSGDSYALRFRVSFVEAKPDKIEQLRIHSVNLLGSGAFVQEHPLLEDAPVLEVAEKAVIPAPVLEASKLLPTEATPVATQLDYSTFWTKAKALGLTAVQVGEKLGVKSLPEWVASGKTLEDAFAQLSAPTAPNPAPDPAPAAKTEPKTKAKVTEEPEKVKYVF